MDEFYKKEVEKARNRGACKEHIERMKFLSKGNNIHNKISKWVNAIFKDEDNYNDWMIEKKDQKIILHKAIQHGIQIALDIQKSLSTFENKRDIIAVKQKPQNP
ncbi:MAG: hypothetical protein KKD44_28830 [Proteobacteria bacterium]|nr:hypothetical protein [Pseudomonadota bacterium]